MPGVVPELRRQRAGFHPRDRLGYLHAVLRIGSSSDCELRCKSVVRSPQMCENTCIRSMTFAQSLWINCISHGAEPHPESRTDALRALWRLGLPAAVLDRQGLQILDSVCSSLPRGAAVLLQGRGFVPCRPEPVQRSARFAGIVRNSLHNRPHGLTAFAHGGAR